MITNIATPVNYSRTQQPTPDNQQKTTTIDMQIYTTNKTNACQPNVNNRQDEITARPGWKLKTSFAALPSESSNKNNC
jgi:hypothetical protein